MDHTLVIRTRTLSGLFAVGLALITLGLMYLGATLQSAKAVALPWQGIDTALLFREAPQSDCWATPNDGSVIYPTVQEAVDAADSGGTVKVAGSCQGVQQRMGISQTVYVSKTLTIRGGYTTTNWIASDPVANLTTLDAQRGGRVVYITGTVAVTLEGLVIMGGNTSGLGRGTASDADGGGIYISTASTTLSGTRVISNTTGDGALGNNGGMGGGIFCSGTLTLTNSLVSDNHTGLGGNLVLISYTLVYVGKGGNGGGIHSIGTLSIVSSTISGNTTGRGGLGGAPYGDGPGGDGGGIYSGGRLSILNSRISGNSTGAGCTGGDGGGIFGDGFITVISSTVDSNDAGSGGDAYHFGCDGGSGGGIYGNGTLTITGSILTGNNTGVGAPDLIDGSGGSGGGISHNGSLIISNSTVKSNRTAAGGGGFVPDEGGDGGGIAASGSAMLNGIIVEDNVAEGGRGGGLFLSADGMMTNILVARNQASICGSGLAIWGSSPRLVHATLASNTDGDGSGVCVHSSYGSACSVMMTNTIIVSHSVGVTTTASSTTTLQATLWSGNTTNTGGAGVIHTGKINVYGPPAFRNPIMSDYHLTPASAAIDQGVDAGVTTDLDGAPRPFGGFDLGAYEAGPEVELRGTPGNRAIYLTWQINTPLPVTSTWRIDYTSGTGTAYLPITGVISSTRTYSLTGLTNYAWYTVTLNAMLDSTPFLTDTVRVMPTDRLVYLPLVAKVQ